MARPALGLCLLVSFTGCTRPNPGFDPPGVSSEETSEATTSATTTPVTAAPTTGEPTTSGSVSAGTGSVGSTDPGSTTEAIATTEPEATTTSTSSSSEGTSTTDGSESSTGNVEPPPPEHLQFYAPDRCDVPLWCFSGGDKFNGVPSRTSSQACFSPSMPPPYMLTRIGYRIAKSSGDLANARLQIHERTDAGPGKLLHEIPVMKAQLEEGAYALLTDKVIDVPGFCVGFIGGSKEPKETLGVGADPMALMPKQSYLRMEETQGVCDVPEFKDITTFNPMAPSAGAWCIDADVVALP